MAGKPSAAVVRLGQMGCGIARNLDAHGLLRAAHDIDPAAFGRARLSDGVKNGPVEGLLSAADIVLFAVPSNIQVAQFLAGRSGHSGQLVVDLTTSEPGLSRRLADELADRGLAYVDAAMTGGAAGADAGTLTLMVGGQDTHVEACRPVLEAIAATIFHLGPVGAGHAMKLVHNMILHAGFMATCEGLHLAERAGIDANRAVAVLNAGNARSFVTEVRFPRDILSGSMTTRSAIANLEKDLGLAQEFAQSCEAPIPYGRLTRAVLAEAVAAGHAGKDFAWLYPLYEALLDRKENNE